MAQSSILETVDDQKKKKYERKRNEFENEREWNRDTFEDHVSDLLNTVQTVDELITDIQTEINRLEGTADQKSKKQRIKEAFNEDDPDRFKRMQRQTMNGGWTPTIEELQEVDAQLADLYRRRSEWKSYQLELVRIGLSKVTDIAKQYRADVVSRDVATSMQELTETVVLPLMKARDEKMYRKFQEMLTDLLKEMSVDPDQIPDVTDGEQPNKTEQIDTLLEENSEMSTEAIKQVVTPTPSESLISERRGEVTE